MIYHILENFQRIKKNIYMWKKFIFGFERPLMGVERTTESVREESSMSLHTVLNAFIRFKTNFLKDFVDSVKKRE